MAEQIRRTARRWLAPLVIWTLFLWLSRLRNVVANDDLDTMGRSLRLGIAGLFLLLGLLAGVWLWRGRPGPVWIGLLAGWTVAYWLVRGTAILLDPGHDASFKVVHALLMVVSIGTVLVAALGVRRTADRLVGGS